MIDPDRIRALTKDAVLGQEGPAHWLPANSSRALLACIGAGPWKAPRRVAVQTAALRWYASTVCSDLSEVRHVQEGVYPLAWQARTLAMAVQGLHRTGDRFDSLCASWVKDGASRWEAAMVQLFDLCGSPPDGLKVLWMFARDHLGLPAFPVDRHVRRALVAAGLPTSSWAMTRACLEAGVSPSALNRGLFPGENPVV